MIPDNRTSRHPQTPAKIRRLLLLAALALLPGCNGGHNGGSPPPTGAAYSAILSAFTIGVTAEETGADQLAGKNLAEVTRLAPEEPAGWADLGLFSLRQNKLDEAARQLEKARSLAPDNPRILFLLGLLESQQGHPAEAVARYRRVIELAPDDLRARYALAVDLERQNNDAEAQTAMAAILDKQPDNLEALLETARLAAKRGDADTARKTVAHLTELGRAWPSEAKEQLTALQKAVAGADWRMAPVDALYLKNVLKQTPAYNASANALSINQIGTPIERFLKLPNPPATPAAPDRALTFLPGPLPGAEKAGWVGSVSLNETGAPVIVSADGRSVRVGNVTLPFPGGASATPPAPHGVTPLDLNSDLKTDLVLTGAGGLKLFQQTNAGQFTDVTAKAGLSASVTGEPLYGAWPADIDADGNLDIVVAPMRGPAFVLRNNGDGSFKRIEPFGAAPNVRDFAWADLNGDGNPDAALLDAQGELHIFMNARGGRFVSRPVPASLGKIAALAVIDTDNNGLLALALLQEDGAITRLADKNDGKDWEATPLARWSPAPSGLNPTNARLLVADLDNNGGLDLLASGPSASQIWLRDEKNQFQPIPALDKTRLSDVADLENNGHLDLLGFQDGKPVRFRNQSAKNYYWMTLRPHINKDRQAPVHQRVNSFGIGGEAEVRAGLLAQKQPISGPMLHFGLGTYAKPDVARIVWPNGEAQVQAEFDDTLKTDQSVTIVQRLNISCPFLFCWNGKEMQFVTDCIWRSPLGLRLNAQDTAGIMQTEDWVKIRGDQLAARDGVYDVRITADLWETHFFDTLSLMTVDHPVGTEVYVDERFAVPPPPLAVYATGPPQPIAHAWDDDGHDVTDILRERDGRHLANFGQGEYQGVTRDHWVEIELPDSAPKTGPLWLIAFGWIRPTNSSVNLAIGQGHFAPPKGLSLEVPDGKGHWAVAKPGLGFPEGKVKTILINLDGVFRPHAPRRLRLRTNLEIYWDCIQWATGLPQTPLVRQRCRMTRAILRYRGFSELQAKDDSSPDLPVSYERVGWSGQRWRDLIGYYTRYGDIRELLAKVDDRYVIMDSGDEMALNFAAPPPPKPGWTRDYVLIGDGWVKDGDYNTTFSKTVLPLPLHSVSSYVTPPGRLEDDPSTLR